MITNNNYQQQLAYGAVKDVVPQRVNEKLPPNVQNFDVKQTVDNNTAVKAVKNSDTDPVTIGLTGAIWLLFAQGCQKLNNSLGKDWDKSWLGKVAQKSENIAKKLNLTKTDSKIKNAKNWIGDHSKILRSFATPTRPQNSMAISQARGITGYVMSDVSSMLGYHIKNGHGDDILNIVKEIKPDFSGSTGKEALSYIDDLFKNCETNKDQISKLIKSLSKKDINVSVDKLFWKVPNIPFLKRKGTFKEMGNKLNAVFGNEVLGTQATKLGKSMPKQTLKTLEGLTNGGAGGKLMIAIQAAIFAQAVKKAMDAPKGEKMSTFTENIANDFGFFLSLPFQVKSSHTLGGLKYIGIGGTSKELVNNSIKDQKVLVEKYRGMIKSLNDKVDKGIISRIDYTKEKAAIKELLKGDSKWYQKPFKAIGKLFSTGLNEESIKHFVDANDKSFGASTFNLLKKGANKIKNTGFGGGLRLVVGMFVVGPLIAKLATKVSHLIFGRPSKSVLDNEEETAQPATQENKSAMDMTKEEFMNKLAAHPELIKKIETDPAFAQQLLSNPEMMTKLLNDEIKLDDVLKEDPRIKNSKYIIQPGQTPQTEAQQPMQQTPAIQPQAQNPTSLNALPQDNTSKMDLFGLGKKNKEEVKEEKADTPNNTDEPIRTYIPSSKPAISGQPQKGSDGLDPTVSAAISKADAAEAEALKRLGI